jgi:methionyl-tRNA formyltransferase
MKITILTDNSNSWILPYVKVLEDTLRLEGEIFHVLDGEDVQEGDILFILSCERILKQDVLKRNTHNVVVHPSKLPQGKGWSPLAWQVLEGSNRIPISLFEVTEEVDAGDIYILDYIDLKGTELNDEIKKLQGFKTVEMCLKFIAGIDTLKPTSQKGEESFYPKRTKKSSELDVDKTIDENFNLLRVVDNERYPAYFYMKEKKYMLKIWECEDE